MNECVTSLEFEMAAPVAQLLPHSSKPMVTFGTLRLEFCSVPCTVPIGTWQRKASSEWRHGFFDFVLTRTSSEPEGMQRTPFCVSTRMTATCLENQNRVRFMNRRERVRNQISRCLTKSLCRNTSGIPAILTSSSPYDVYARWWRKNSLSLLCALFSSLFLLSFVVPCTKFHPSADLSYLTRRCILYMYSQC